MRLVFAVILLFAALAGTAQNYHAVQGSSYAGSLGIANNPASMLNTPYKWDVTIFGQHLKSTTNIITIHDYSLLGNPAKSSYSIDSGEFARRGLVVFNTNLFNTRITLDRKQAIGFGINLRGYTRIKSSEYKFLDTIKGAPDFFNMNQGNQPMDARGINSTWLEIFVSYARTIVDNTKGRLNAGFTLKGSRGVSGAYFTVENIRFEREPGGIPTNVLSNARANYGYSINFDQWKKENSASQNLGDLRRYADGGASCDIGVEYLVKTQEVPTYEDDDYYDYNWKLSLSLLDAGLNQYRYGRESRSLAGIRPDMVDTLLDNKFRNATSFAHVNDSLATIAQSFSSLKGQFSVVNPTRLVQNADRFLINDFYINGEISINLSSLMKKYHYVNELNFITITPRWETHRWGAYLPIQYNVEGKFWVGGAFKAGPLLFGFHNWANIFSKKSMQNGGGYIALTLRSWNDSWNKRDRRLNCPD